MRPVFTPMRVAASLSWAVARMERPRSVLMRKKNMATVKAMAIANAIIRALLKEMFPRKKVWLA